MRLMMIIGSPWMSGLLKPTLKVLEEFAVTQVMAINFETSGKCRYHETDQPRRGFVAPNPPSTASQDSSPTDTNAVISDPVMDSLEARRVHCAEGGDLNPPIRPLTKLSKTAPKKLATYLLGPDTDHQPRDRTRSGTRALLGGNSKGGRSEQNYVRTMNIFQDCDIFRVTNDRPIGKSVDCVEAESP